jgi:Tfp pilus assembly protein PilO
VNIGIWRIGTALVVVVIVALGWFLGISPQLSRAGIAADQLADVKATNAQQEAELAALKKQFASLPEIEAEIEELRETVPAVPNFAEFMRNLDTFETRTGARMLAYSADPSIPYAASAETTNKGEASTSITGENFMLIPISFEIGGSYAQNLDFVKRVQTNQRLYLMTDINIKEVQVSAGAIVAPGTPELYQFQMSGYLYVLLDPTYVPVSSTPEPEIEPTPAPTGSGIPTPNPTDTPAP